MARRISSVFRFVGLLLLFDLWMLVFLFHMAIYWGDWLAWKLLRYDRKSQFVRAGHCEQTGLCCQNLAVEIPLSWVRRPWIVAAFQRWYAVMHNFQTVGPPQGRLLPLSCGHLRGGHTCSIYPFRPKLCREFPPSSFFGHIQLHRGCGFWFLERAKLGSFEDKLRREEHAAERRDFLRETEK